MRLRTITAVSLLVGFLGYGLWDWTLGAAALLFAVCLLGLLALAFAFLCTVCAFVDMDKPQEEDSPFYRAVMHLYIEALIPLVRLKIETSGLEKAPKDGRFLLVCNHQNESDPGILLHYFKKGQLAFISKKENRSMFVVGKIMHKNSSRLFLSRIFRVKFISY